MVLIEDETNEQFFFLLQAVRKSRFVIKFEIIMRDNCVNASDLKKKKKCFVFLEGT